MHLQSLGKIRDTVSVSWFLLKNQCDMLIPLPRAEQLLNPRSAHSERQTTGRKVSRLQCPAEITRHVRLSACACPYHQLKQYRNFRLWFNCVLSAAHDTSGRLEATDMLDRRCIENFRHHLMLVGSRQDKIAVQWDLVGQIGTVSREPVNVLFEDDSGVALYTLH